MEQRDLLANFLAREQDKLGFCPEILHRAVHIMDRYLSKVFVPQVEHFVTIAIACFYLAVKHEVDEPEYSFKRVLERLVLDGRVLDHTLSREQVLPLEFHVFETLGFQLERPTSFDFFPTFWTQGGTCLDCERPRECWARPFVEYLLDLALCSSKFIGMKPSLVALSAIGLGISSCCTNFAVYYGTYRANWPGKTHETQDILHTMELLRQDALQWPRPPNFVDVKHERARTVLVSRLPKLDIL